METPAQAKVAIIGAGRVGANVAYTAMLRKLPCRLVLYDANPTKGLSQCLDLTQVSEIVESPAPTCADEVGVCKDADVIVLTIGARMRVGQIWLDQAANNLAMFRKLLPQLVTIAPGAVLVIATNPVELLTQASIALSGLPAARVLGVGTIVESKAFRVRLARKFSVPLSEVQGFVVGERGSGQTPLWSSVKISGRGVAQVSDPGFESQRLEITEPLKEMAMQIRQDKGVSDYVLALAAVEVVQAILGDQRIVLPVSTLLENFMGMGDRCLSMPARVGRSGVLSLEALELSGAERAQLAKSAEQLKAALKTASEHGVVSAGDSTA